MTELQARTGMDLVSTIEFYNMRIQVVQSDLKTTVWNINDTDWIDPDLKKALADVIIKHCEAKKMDAEKRLKEL